MSATSILKQKDETKIQKRKVNDRVGEGKAEIREQTTN